jgi:hypothetical protein
MLVVIGSDGVGGGIIIIWLSGSLTSAVISMFRPFNSTYTGRSAKSEVYIVIH